jgi:hypothetical protein
VAELAWFVELTAATELDLAQHNAEFRIAYGRALLDLFSRCRELLGPAAWQDCTKALGGEAEEKPAG